MSLSIASNLSESVILTQLRYIHACMYLVELPYTRSGLHCPCQWWWQRSLWCHSLSPQCQTSHTQRQWVWGREGREGGEEVVDTQREYTLAGEKNSSVSIWHTNNFPVNIPSMCTTEQLQNINNYCPHLEAYYQCGKILSVHWIVSSIWSLIPCLSPQYMSVRTRLEIICYSRRLHRI